MKRLSINQQKILLPLALILLCPAYFGFFDFPSLFSFEDVPFSEAPKEVVVEVAGAVKRPGIFFFNGAPSLSDAIRQSGGFNKPVRFDGISGWETLETGTLLTVVRESSGEIRVRVGRMEAGKLVLFFIPIDLNRVREEDLRLIPGIGEVLSREILAYRERRGGFRSLEELRQVRGIGEKRLDALRPYLVVRP